MNKQSKMRIKHMSLKVNELKTNVKELQNNINRLLHYVEYFKLEYEEGKYIKSKYRKPNNEWFWRV